MSNPQDRMIYQSDDETWVNRRHDELVPTSSHDDVAAAIQQARKDLRAEGGGTLNVLARDGRVNFSEDIAGDPKR